MAQPRGTHAERHVVRCELVQRDLRKYRATYSAKYLGKRRSKYRAKYCVRLTAHWLESCRQAVIQRTCVSRTSQDFAAPTAVHRNGIFSPSRTPLDVPLLLLHRSHTTDADRRLGVGESANRLREEGICFVKHKNNDVVHASTASFSAHQMLFQQRQRNQRRVQ